MRRKIGRTASVASGMLTSEILDIAIAELSNHHEYRVLDQGPERAEELGAERAIDGAVIGRKRDRHHPLRFDLAVAHDRTFLAGADREHGGMRRVDDRGEILDAVHPEI